MACAESHVGSLGQEDLVSGSVLYIRGFDGGN